jgi:hypothetical protein
MKFWKTIAAAAVLAVSLTGCASPEFNRLKEQSLKEVTALYKAFDIPGFILTGEVKEGSWDFSKGGDPNAAFHASAENSNLTSKEICDRVLAYAKQLSSTELTYYPTPALNEDHFIVHCIASMKTRDYGGIELRGQLASGVTFGVNLWGTSFSVVTRLYDRNGSGPEPDIPMDLDQSVADYMFGLQEYRVANGIKLFTAAELEKVGLVAKSDTAELTPIVDSDGFIRRIHIKYQNYWEDQCWSAAPWDAKDWTVADPGAPYPQYTVESLDELTNFGSLLMSSDCTQPNSK